MRKHRHCGTSEPDLSRCRTSRVGAVIPGVHREMYYCGIDNAQCRYAIPFGYDYICRHSDNHSFPPPEGGPPGFR